jgi:hypothetical protein
MLAKHPLRQRFALKVVSHGLPRCECRPL